MINKRGISVAILTVIMLILMFVALILIWFIIKNPFSESTEEASLASNIETGATEDTEICGNGILEIGEQCDDGNTNDGDGCSSTCQIEAGTVECDDGIDNDNDTFIDFPDDPGCTNPSDTSELGIVQCDDGIDNDNDTFIDFPDDPSCTNPSDTSELGIVQCDDGIDNDNDTFIDFPDDPSCTNSSDTSELGIVQCDDGIDNDNDTFIDFPDDPGCTNSSDTSELGIDNGESTQALTTIKNLEGISWWKFDGDANDEMGGNNGIVIGAVFNSTGKYNGAYEFDGVDDYVLVAANSSLDLINNTDYTFSMWISATDLSSFADKILMQYKKGDGKSRIIIGIKSGGSTDCAGEFYSFIGNNKTCSGISASSGWVHVILTVTENEANDIIQFYINGNAEGSGIVDSETNDNADLMIGTQKGLKNFFSGTIDEVIIFNRALSASESSDLYNLDLS